MNAEGKIFCPLCGQPEIVRFIIGPVTYFSSWRGAERRLKVEISGAGYVSHDCPADTSTKHD